jgi:hypothetical protein
MTKTEPTLFKDQLSKFKETLDKRKKYIKNEFQSYGLDLAKELGDWKNRSLYLRLAKQIDRNLLEKARLFVKDQNPNTIKTPYKLFMWKLKELNNLKK